MSVQINQFPTKQELERVNVLRKYQKLSEDKQLEVLKLHELIKKQYKNVSDLVYLSHAIPARISEFYGDFVMGDADRMVIKANTDNEDSNTWVDDVVYESDIKESISDWAEEQSQFGFVALLGYVDDNEQFHITSVPADQYFPQRDGSVVFVTYRKDPKFPTGDYFLAHVQHYQMKDGKAIVEHQGFRADKRGVMIESVSLEHIGQFVGRTLEETEDLGIDELPIRQIDNGRRHRWGFGKSDYYDIMPQLAETNERSTHISTQLLKNIDAKLAVPETSLTEDEEGNATLNNKEAFVVSKEDAMPQYITNSNPLIESAENHIMRQLKIIEWVSGVPMWALTKGNMPERVETLRIQLFAAMRKTSKKRAKMRRGLMDMFRIGAKLTNQSEELTKKDVIIDFSDALPVDELSQVQTESEKIRSGISSRKAAMQRIENYDDDTADAELERIKSEDQIAGIGAPENAPQV